MKCARCSPPMDNSSCHNRHTAYGKAPHKSGAFLFIEGNVSDRCTSGILFIALNHNYLIKTFVHLSSMDILDLTPNFAPSKMTTKEI